MKDGVGRRISNIEIANSQLGASRLTKKDETMSAEYYILDARSCVGNCALWWGPNGGGYTCELSKAGLYTLDEASSHRATDIPVHRSIAENRVLKHVRWESLRRAGVDINKAQRGYRPEVVEPEQPDQTGDTP